jgi:hypothetical protein
MQPDPKRTKSQTMSIPQFMEQDDQIVFTDAERNAMRAYLQRCEVRLSTLHRIATAFISGAGLLLLIPVFFRDVVDGIIEVLISDLGNQFTMLADPWGGILSAVLYTTLMYPMFLSLLIPLYGVYLLLKDIVHFYFTIYMPGFSAQLLNPTFALSGVMFSVDESPRVKREVMRYEYIPEHMDFMIPFSAEKRERYFERMVESTEGLITPSSRKLEDLRDQGWLPPTKDEKIENDMRDFNAALGLARAMDRTLAQEVAVTEMSLVRHVLYLRRLVLRYVKTLLMFIWTTLVSFLMLPLVKEDQFPTFVVLGIGYTVWALGVMPVIRYPLHWIYRHRYGEMNHAHIDSQLTLLERGIEPFCYVAIFSALIGLVLATITLVG